MNYSIWRNRAGLSPMKFYNIKIDAVKRTRKFEEADYQFVAADCELTAYDAEELRADLLNGDEILFAVKDDAGNYLFRGTFQSEGTKYDAEKEQYTFSVVHISKQLFSGFEKTYSRFPLSVWLNIPYHELKPGVDAYADANFGERYNTRSYLLDLCKVMGCIVGVDDNYTISGQHGDIILNTVNLFSRKEIQARAVKIGFDDFVADYSYEDKKADYEYVLLPIAFYFTSYSYVNSQGVLISVTNSPHYVLGYIVSNGKRSTVTIFNNLSDGWITTAWLGGIAQSGNGVQFRFVGTDYQLEVPDRTLDLRIEALKNVNAALSQNYWNMTKVIYETDSNIPQTLVDYVNERKESLLDYTEISVTYSRLIDADLLEKIAFHDKIISIREIEDDLQWEDRTIKGRIYKT